MYQSCPSPLCKGEVRRGLKLVAISETECSRFVRQDASTMSESGE